jgi:hypothetical protein
MRSRSAAKLELRSLYCWFKKKKKKPTVTFKTCRQHQELWNSNARETSLIQLISSQDLCCLLKITSMLWTSEWLLEHGYKFSYPCNRSWRPIVLWDAEVPTFSRQSAHRWRLICQPYAPAAIYSPGRFLVLISVRTWVELRAIVRLEGLGQLKKKIQWAHRDLNPRPSGL